jgi:hypothetical protein
MRLRVCIEIPLSSRYGSCVFKGVEIAPTKGISGVRHHCSSHNHGEYIRFSLRNPSNGITLRHRFEALDGLTKHGDCAGANKEDAFGLFLFFVGVTASSTRGIYNESKTGIFTCAAFSTYSHLFSFSQGHRFP